MAFWLARTRNGQHSDYIQRFDPRFWTVNFPRPMMASVVSTAPDALRVDCEFVKAGDLAGLIWDSEDTLDHPLLAYDTRRDYARCTLSFRWRSGNVLALDVEHGPTLTIEGRDASGTPRSWYVRLWNYAVGSPSDAVVTLPFSELQSGFTLPGEAVWPSDIDRMFISLVPPGYEEGNETPLANRVVGWAEVSDLRCEGEGAMLPIGDVLLPEHGEGMCTAYDDSFNQTPARLLRVIEGLGCRGKIVHYVGMSHYYRLWLYGSDFHAAYNGDLCQPAIAWHSAYFEAAVALGFAPVVSLSYELLLQNCPVWFRQRDRFGNDSQTGWSPPSALLSPTSGQVNTFLQNVATNFVALLEAAGGEPLFQIGEPWWWVAPETGAPCLYDSTARAYFGDSLRWISDMREPLPSGGTQMLDMAGTALAASTMALADAVRSAAQGEAQIHLLAFTPTILDPAMPELHRACLPSEWAWPTFDRLQLEDYDWLVEGRDAARRAGYAFVDQKLGYPAEATEYLSGFVLDPADAEEFWPRIDEGLDEARERGVAQRYVWALPQVNRDGYTRLPPGDDTMNAFDDVPYPLALGRDAAASPEFSTSVAVTASGYEHRNALWSDARMRYDVGPGIRSEKELGSLVAFFRARFGPARGFRLRDPFDFSSGGMTGSPSPGDQLLGAGDGVASRFQLSKSYGEQRRTITRPDIASIRVAVDGAETTDWSYEEGGWIVFNTAPAEGTSVTAGFHFDVPVRFAEDRLDISGVSFAAGEAPSVPLIEIREAP
ncbi:DUF2460 domain-containing protein [Qipengyuania flava]|uniref:DUF2460 domain-containing protein n=1 Tax=Qipengyuania flava TaxID=192812 RepID=UPI001C627D61|nr:DUF2460 domain-containing protein [Qipengyuania flava]QYJ07157.1 DUF2460 domain-containing protein [Qipengyuania flava]